MAHEPGSHGRFCLVVTELLGHRTAGGIATATTFLAELLAAAGHEVTLIDAVADDETLSDIWRSRYRSNGIVVERLDRRQQVSPPYVADSYRTYHQLKDRDFDVIVFQDWRGLGYCAMSAKRSGLAFENTRLVHIVHGPSRWLWEANQTIELDAESFAVAHIEQRSAELADTVVGPSQYLLDWMHERWALPADCRQIFYPTASMVGLDVRGGTATGGADEPSNAKLTELVFFGRYEERKGVRIFAQALNRLGAERLAGLTVTFLGRAVPFSGRDIIDMLDDDVAQALDGPHFISDLDSLAARAYLAGPGRVALIPSLIDNSPNVVIECIEDGIAFLAAASGGIPELVAPVDRERVLFEPTATAFADRLGELLAAGTVAEPAGQGWVDADILPAWEALLAPPPPIETPTDRPLVSVIIPHHNQLELFAHTLTSVVSQDYPNLEIIVVDDGTPDTDMVATLAELLDQPWGRPISLIRQDNAYLGARRATTVCAPPGASTSPLSMTMTSSNPPTCQPWSPRHCTPVPPRWHRCSSPISTTDLISAVAEGFPTCFSAMPCTLPRRGTPSVAPAASCDETPTPRSAGSTPVTASDTKTGRCCCRSRCPDVGSSPFPSRSTATASARHRCSARPLATATCAPFSTRSSR